MDTTKYTKEEIEQMVAGSGFGKGTPARQAAEYNAEDHDFDYVIKDCNASLIRECVEDAYISGIIWCLEHLK
jgi:hypothetical protein